MSTNNKFRKSDILLFVALLLPISFRLWLGIHFANNAPLREKMALDLLKENNYKEIKIDYQWLNAKDFPCYYKKTAFLNWNYPKDKDIIFTARKNGETKVGYVCVNLFEKLKQIQDLGSEFKPKDIKEFL